MAIDTSERQFESDIEASLIAHQNAIKVDPSLYDRESMLFPVCLLIFLKVLSQKSGCDTKNSMEFTRKKN